MIEDARTVPERSVLRADICIVGAGAAGITLARHYIGRRTTVLLIESGDFDFSEKTQSLYVGEVSQGLYDLELSRLRYFGGSTNHWGGVCRPLDADDFQVRDWVPHSGWPIALADLQPYYDRACGIVELSSQQWDNKSWQDKLAGFFRLPFMGERIAGAVFQLSPPTHFGEVYRDALAAAGNVRTLLNANVTDISTDRNAARVTGLQVACLDGPRFSVEAKVYILATGAVEIARLLLVADGVQAPGLGNGHDLVGRYYMNHPGFYGADILLSEPEDSLVKPMGATHTILPRLVITPQESRRQRLGKFSAWVHGVDESGRLEASDGYRALRGLIRDLGQGNFSGALLDELTRLLGDLDGAAQGVWSRFRPARMVRLDPEWEHTPNPDSRVTLMANRDQLGLRRVRVDWRLSEFDILTAKRSLEIIGEVVGQAGFGRIRVDEWLLSPGATPATFPGHENYHASGTTRMSDDPAQGVVDRDCRVHSVANLYVCGSSVFPTIGAVNPTLTAVALSLRLADHIEKITA